MDVVVAVSWKAALTAAALVAALPACTPLVATTKHVPTTTHTSAAAKPAASKPKPIQPVVPAPSAQFLIDQAAADRYFPADAVINVKTAYGAKGDGVTDDTAALQRAISANIGFEHISKTLYFPKGTYLISSPLVWKNLNGAWDTGITIQGQNRDSTILKLADHSAAFQTATQSQPMLMTASQNAQTDGSGTEAFLNDVFDVTINVGTGNPGANGVDYLANNRGAIRNVVITAPSGSGGVGLSMTRYATGPALVSNVRITGFDTGVLLTNSEYGVTFEHLRLMQQRSAGLVNQDNIVSLRDLRSTEGAAPVVVARSVNAVPLTVVNGATLRGQSTRPALVSSGGLRLAAMTWSGFSALSSSAGSSTPAAATSGSSANFDTTSGVGQTNSAASAAAGLTVKETPTIPDLPASQWVSVASFGAHPDDYGDDTAAIQAALNSHHSVVYLPPGQYRLSGTLVVPADVQQIQGLGSWFGTGHSTADAPVLRLTGASANPLLISRLFFFTDNGVSGPSVRNETSRSVVLQDLMMQGYSNAIGAGDLFLEDVCGPSFHFDHEHVWARQFNPEVREASGATTNAGGTLWILGFKTEGEVTALTTTGGGTSEIHGGLLYPVWTTSAQLPALISVDSHVSATFAVSAFNATSGYPVQLQSTVHGVTSDVSSSGAPRRGYGFVQPFISTS